MTQSKFHFKFITTAVLCSLLFSVVFFSCKKNETPPVVIDKTALLDTINVATALFNGTVEGTKPGQYVVGSKVPFKTAIDAANVVNSNASATQSDVTNATAQLHAAADIYRGNLIHEIAAANLIGFWKFNGNANDSSGHNNNGAVMQGHVFFGAGTPSLTVDRFGRANMCYHFDHGGNVEVPYTSALNPPQFSISIWVRQDTIGRRINPANCYMVSLNRWNGFKFQTQPSLPFLTVHAIEPAGDTTYYDRDDAGVPLIPGATWYHLVATFKPGEMDFYINGSLVKSWTNTPGTPITVSSAINFTIGSDLPTGYYLTTDPSGNRLVDYGGFWTGDLDDVMFYNIALSASDVSSIYDNQKSL